MEDKPIEEKEHTHYFKFEHQNTEHEGDDIYVWAYAVCQTCGEIKRTKIN